MSEDENDTSNEGGEDLKNLKGEFSRKFKNQEDQLRQLTEANQQMLAAIQTMAQSRQEEVKPNVSDSEELEDLVFSNPAKFAEKIAETVSSKLASQVDQKLSNKDQQAAQMAQMMAEYPELNDTDHPMTKDAVSIYGKMSKAEQANPSAYKQAILEAAMGNGLLPKSKRGAISDEDFSLPAGTRYNSSVDRKGRKGKLHPAALDLAEKLGMPVGDKEYVEKLKYHSTKKLNEWTKY